MNTVISVRANDMEYFDGYVFLNKGDYILKIHLKDGAASTVSLNEKGNDIIVYNGSNILLCCQTKAKYIKT